MLIGVALAADAFTKGLSIFKDPKRERLGLLVIVISIVLLLSSTLFYLHAFMQDSKRTTSIEAWVKDYLDAKKESEPLDLAIGRLDSALKTQEPLSAAREDAFASLWLLALAAAASCTALLAEP